MVTRAHTRATVTWGESFKPPAPEVWGDTILVMVPHLILTVTGPDALLAWMRAWSVAARYAEQVWPEGPTGREVPPPPADTANRLTLALRLTAEVGGPEIGARTAGSDPDGRGHLTMTLDPIRCVILHGTAWGSAWATWTAAYAAGRRLWKEKLPPLDEVTASAIRWHRHQTHSKRLGLL